MNRRKPSANGKLPFQLTQLGFPALNMPFVFRKLIKLHQEWTELQKLNICHKVCTACFSSTPHARSPIQLLIEFLFCICAFRMYIFHSERSIQVSNLLTVCGFMQFFGRDSRSRCQKRRNTEHFNLDHKMKWKRIYFWLCVTQWKWYDIIIVGALDASHAISYATHITGISVARVATTWNIKLHSCCSTIKNAA